MDNNNRINQKQIIIDRFLRSEESHKFNLNIYEKMLMIMLASYMGKNDTCWPSLPFLISACSASKNTILRTIKSLERKNIIKVIRIKEKNNIYEFNLKMIKVIHSTAENQYEVVPVGHQVVPVGNHGMVPHRHPNNININNKKNNAFEHERILSKEVRTEMPNELRQMIKRIRE